MKRIRNSRPVQLLAGSVLSAAVIVGAAGSHAAGVMAGRAPADTGSHPIYILNDTVRPEGFSHLNMQDIGLMELGRPDSLAMMRGDTIDVIRLFTKEFMRQHPERFSDVPAATVDTLP